LRYEYREVFDWYRVPTYFLFKFTRRTNDRWLNSFCDFGINRVRFYHFFNTIPFGKKPFFVTFEHYLPRFVDVSRDTIRRGFDALASSRCKKTFATSSYAFESQSEYLREEWPTYADEILKKSEILLPSQRNYLDHDPTKWQKLQEVIFSVIGADFFRKGGLEILKVFDRAIQRRMPIRLNIVSSLDVGDYASRSGGKERDAALALIERNRERIQFHGPLPHRRVMELLNESHLLLLPSYDETYGYS